MDEAKLGELFGGNKRFALLRLLFLNPKRQFTNKELVENGKVSVGNASRWLKRWAELGLVQMHVDGRNTTYQASDDPLLEGLTDIVRRSDAILADIKEVLPSEAEVAVIFGSQARGQEHAESDIDVLVLGTEDISEIRVNAALRAVGRKHNRMINASVFSAVKFEQLLRDGDDFAVNVVRQKTIPVKGYFGYGTTQGPAAA